MAVYTQVSAEALTAVLRRYDDVGELVSAKGIAEGVENSNYLIDTTTSRYILTLYEKRVDAGDLPFFLDLLDHCAARGLPVPPAIRDREGIAIQTLEGRPACLIRFLNGVSLTLPTPEQAATAGAALGDLHAAVADFDGRRANSLGIADWRPLLERCGSDLDRIAPGLFARIDTALAAVEADWPHDLPASVIHADLFPDNVLTLGAPLDGVGPALLGGYTQAFGLSDAERAALPVLAQGACIRFLLTRAWDWLNTPADALVTRKDPLAYLRRLDWYDAHPETFA